MKPTEAQVILDSLLEYFEDRSDASMEPGEDRFHGNSEMNLLGEVEYVEAALNRISEGNVASQWIPVSEPPTDEQTVLGYWPSALSMPGNAETVTYYAEDAPDGPAQWRDAFGNPTDAPTLWRPWEAPGELQSQGECVEITERGPWGVMVIGPKVGITSDDFEHDVVLWVSGDFEDDAQLYDYAVEIAKRLNLHSPSHRESK